VAAVETVYELDRLVKGEPKSEASIRKVVPPELIIPDLARHLETFAGRGPDGFVFVGIKGGQLRRSNFSKPWARALAKAGLPAETHVHDLRQTGNTISAEAGASLAELMSRMGHSSARGDGVPACQKRARPAARREPGPDGPAGTEAVCQRLQRHSIGHAAGTRGCEPADAWARRSCRKGHLTWLVREWSG
jgi:hypothetical protein